MTRAIRLALAAVGIVGPAFADDPGPRLPDPLTSLDGAEVRTPAGWERRRAELKRLFESVEYGPMPPRPETLEVAGVALVNDPAAGATRRASTIRIGHAGRSMEIGLRVAYPGRGGFDGPRPVVVQVSFGRRVDPDTGRPSTADDRKRELDARNREKVYLDRGYVVAEFDAADVAVDDRDRCKTSGVYALFGDVEDTGALMAWAWGVSRVVDALELDPVIDRSKIVVTGHSRFGKAALVAGAFDERVALTAPNHSGCGGAAPYRLVFGKAERLGDVAGRFPHWFRPDFKRFADRVGDLPVDQNELRALVAPRGLLAVEGTDDAWSNPEGAQRCHVDARRAWDLLGVPDRVATHFRPVGHVVTPEDVADFADFLFFAKPLPEGFGKLPYPAGT